MKSLKSVFVAGFVFLGLGLFNQAALAADLGQITDTLMTPTKIITKLLIFACYVVGAILIFAAMAQYKIHRQSPKLVPLTTPILLLFLGVGLLVIPYFTSLPQQTGSVVEQAKRSGADEPPPSQFSTTGSQQPTGPGSLPADEPAAPSEPPPSNGGSWRDKYR